MNVGNFSTSIRNNNISVIASKNVNITCTWDCYNQTGDNDILISAVCTRTSNKRIETRFIFCKNR